LPARPAATTMGEYPIRKMAGQVGRPFAPGSSSFGRGRARGPEHNRPALPGFGPAPPNEQYEAPAAGIGGGPWAGERPGALKLSALERSLYRGLGFDARAPEGQIEVTANSYERLMRGVAHQRAARFARRSAVVATTPKQMVPWSTSDDNTTFHIRGIFVTVLFSTLAARNTAGNMVVLLF